MTSLETTGASFRETLWQDLRYGARLLWKSKGFTFAAVLSLALGIGANTAIFSVVNSVFLRPLSFPQSEQLVYVWATAPERGVRQTGDSLPKFRQFQEQQQVFTDLAAQLSTSFTLTGQGDPALLQGTRVTSGFFRTLGVKPQLGREFVSEDDQGAGAPVIMLSYVCWQRRFGGQPMLGKTLELDGKPYTVIGIMPAELSFPYEENEVWMPRVDQVPDLPPEQIERGSGYLQIIGRMKPGVSMAQAQGSLATIAERYKQAYPGNVDATFGVIVKSFQENWLGATRSTFQILFGAVAFVLLIACGNVAILMLARFSRRNREIAVRAVLGAGRFRIIQQFLTESVLLGVLGGILGGVLGVLGVRLMVLFGQDFIPRAQEIKLDYKVLLFTLGISLVTGVLIGLVPALQTSRTDLNSILKEASRTSTGSAERMRLRKLLVVSEIALSMILLIGASLLVVSFMRLQSVALGFEPKNLFVVYLDLPETKYGDPEKKSTFANQLVERLNATAGIKSSAAADSLPVSGTNSTVYAVIGRPIPEVPRRPLTDLTSVSPTYFDAMNIPVIRGRSFNDNDRLESTKVIIISKSMADRVFNGEDAVGQRMIVGSRNNDPRDVIGVVGDVRPSLAEDPRDQVYLPLRQRPVASIAAVVRTAGDAQGALPAIREALKEIDPNQPITATRTMQELIDRSVSSRRVSMVLMSLFAVLAMFMAAIGLSATISYTVSERTSEIGIRMALGAHRLDILRLIMRQGLLLSIIGIVIGLVGAYALTKLLTSMLFGVSATEPMAFVVVAAVLAFIAMLACYLPARRATKIQPMIALRNE
ncbi:MAG TPA: ABC transporter permease [Pyrinomonadaceae bacterium]